MMGCGDVWELGWVGGWMDGRKVEVCVRAVVGWGGVGVGSEEMLAAYLSIVAIFLKPHR